MEAYRPSRSSLSAPWCVTPGQQRLVIVVTHILARPGPCPAPPRDVCSWCSLQPPLLFRGHEHEGPLRARRSAGSTKMWHSCLERQHLLTDAARGHDAGALGRGGCRRRRGG